MADSVISSKVTRLVVSGSRSRISAMCQAIASPSRSRSGASHTVVACFAAALSADDVLLGLLGHLVAQVAATAVLDLDGEVGAREVTDMAVRGEDLERAPR